MSIKNVTRSSLWDHVILKSKKYISYILKCQLMNKYLVLCNHNFQIKNEKKISSLKMADVFIVNIASVSFLFHNPNNQTINMITQYLLLERTRLSI